MRIVVFGSSGKLGTGLVEGLQYSGFSEIYSPLRNELNLSVSGEVERYLKKVQPNVVINSAGLTTNQDSTMLKQIQVFNYNTLLSQNVFNVLKKFTDCVYIEIGSASIYESFPIEKISELDFNQINEYYPKIEYSKSKVRQSIEIFEAAKNGSNMYSLILPYVIYTGTKPMNNPGLFNRISESIIDARNNDTEFNLDPKINSGVIRQFVHGFDVGRFCTKILKNEFKTGIIHLPHLPEISISKFLCQHLQIFNLNNQCICQETINLKPTLTSVYSSSIDFIYVYNADTIVNKLLEKYINLN